MKISCTYVKPSKTKRAFKEKKKVYDSYSSSKSSGGSDSDTSDIARFKKEHKIDTLYEPDDDRPKIVI